MASRFRLETECLFWPRSRTHRPAASTNRNGLASAAQLTKTIGDALRPGTHRQPKLALGRGHEASITACVTLRRHRLASGIAASCVGVNAPQLY
jgi:hypothetical protein